MDLEEFATLHGLRVKQDLDGTAIIPGKGHSHLYEYDDEVLGVLIMPVPPRSSQSWTRIPELSYSSFWPSLLGRLGEWIGRCGLESSWPLWSTSS